MQIDGFRLHFERIPAAASGYQFRRAERSAKLRHETLQSVACRRRRVRSPYGVDQLIGGHCPTTLQRQDDEERTQLRPGDDDRVPVVVQNLELAEKSDLHASTVSASRSVGWRAQLVETLPGTCTRVDARNGCAEEVDDHVVASELSEVLEREVDRSRHAPATAQLAKFVDLSFAAGHVRDDPPIR
jgi:hypothetical protein